MNTQNNLQLGTGAVAEATEFFEAFERLQSEIVAVPEQELMLVNLDMPTAMTTVLGSLKDIVNLRAELVKLPGFDVARFDKLRDYALALGHTHGGYRAAQGPVDPIGKLSEEVSVLRDLLHTDALALAKRGLLDEGRVGKLRSGVGHRNVAFDVVGLVL